MKYYRINLYYFAPVGPEAWASKEGIKLWTYLQGYVYARKIQFCTIHTLQKNNLFLNTKALILYNINVLFVIILKIEN